MSMFNPLQPVNGWGALGAPPIAMIVAQTTMVAQQQFSTVVPVTAVTGLPIGSAAVSGTSICHVTVVVSIPGTVIFAHGLLYKPTMCWIIPELAEGTTPTIFMGAVTPEFTATNIVFNVSAAATYDVYYC